MQQFFRQFYGTNAENLSTRPDHENVIAKCDLFLIKMVTGKNGQSLIRKAVHILTISFGKELVVHAALENTYIFHTFFPDDKKRAPKSSINISKKCVLRWKKLKISSSFRLSLIWYPKWHFKNTFFSIKTFPYFWSFRPVLIVVILSLKWLLYCILKLTLMLFWASFGLHKLLRQKSSH